MPLCISIIAGRNFFEYTVHKWVLKLELITRPCALTVEQLTAARVLAFLESLEKDRHNSVGTRNIRLAAIKSFFRYLEYRAPSCLNLALQVRAIPQKRAEKPLIDWLDGTEMQLILDAPDTATVAGLRDRAMLHLCYAAGLRVSELTTLVLENLSSPGLEYVRILGKGRRERELPLWNETKSVLNEWLDVRPAVKNRYLFLNARGRPMSPDGFAYILKKHVATATRTRPSLKDKRVTPHVIRHSTAMMILHATGDIRKVSLWLGHANLKSTEVYLRASPAEKLEILQANAPPSIRRGAFPGARDSLMSMLGAN